MKADTSPDVIAWLRTKPSLDALRENCPEIWEEVERELGVAVAEQNHAGLHALLNPPGAAIVGNFGSGKTRTSLREQALIVRSAIKQRMAALALERHSLAVRLVGRFDPQA